MLHCPSSPETPLLGNLENFKNKTYEKTIAKKDIVVFQMEHLSIPSKALTLMRQ